MAEEKKQASAQELALMASILGGGIGLASMAQNAGPGGISRMYADYANNYLEGFYQKGIGQSGKLGLYAQEAARAGLRMPHVNPIEALAYKNTGVSGYLANQVSSMNPEIQKILDDYVQYGDRSNAERKIKMAINKAHHKVTNDFSNSVMLGGKKSKSISGYASKYVGKSNMKEFIELTGDKDVAKYVNEKM